MLPQSGYTRFRINWGRVHGAEAKRILAHVCRRADIESNRIGAISVQLHFSTFDVTADRAEEFARRVQPRDRRDPELIITREDLRRAGSGKREHQSDAGE
jgi:ATP-dependent RNA helicase DeaD